jgi:lysosomal acid lipase/cholesteryl ester hydrolase
MLACVLLAPLVASHPAPIPELNPITDQTTFFDYLSRKLNLEPEAYMNVPQIIQYSGFPIELHHVHTGDGWTLEMHRIPWGRSGDDGSRRTPVMMLPMIAFSSAVFTVNTPDQSPAFIYADEGYDVWLVNYRATVYSWKHNKYERGQKEYWNFTMEDYGRFDLPAMIDYVLQVTGQEKVHMVTQMAAIIPPLITLSTMPQYNDKVKMITGLSPTISLMYGDAPAHMYYRINNANRLFDFLFEFFNGQFVVKEPASVLLSRLVCKFLPEDLLRKLILLGYGSHDARTTNSSRFAVVISHLADGISFRAVAHTYQLIKSGHFARYDYGSAERNMIVYGQVKPDQYPLDKVTVPVLATYISSDNLLGRDDVIFLTERLRHSLLYKVRHLGWQHLDYFFGKETRNGLYLPLIDLMRQFEQGQLSFDILREL